MYSHPVNFDENTSFTAFTLTVVAYQWGWNYYFPQDIVDIYWVAPKHVGHGQVESSLSDSRYYDTLLDYTRKSIVTRATNGARYSSKSGKNVAPNALSLFLQPAFLTSKFDQTPSLFANPLFFDSVRSSIGSLSNRLFTSEVGDKLTTRLLELLDEGGVAANVVLNQTRVGNDSCIGSALGVSAPIADQGTSFLSANNT